MMKNKIKKLKKAFPAQEKGCEYYADGCRLMFSSHGDGIFIGEFRKDYGPAYAAEIAELLNTAPELLESVDTILQLQKDISALKRKL